MKCVVCYVLLPLPLPLIPSLHDAPERSTIFFIKDKLMFCFRAVCRADVVGVVVAVVGAVVVAVATVVSVVSVVVSVSVSVSVAVAVFE